MIRTTTRTTDIVLCGMFVALMAVGAFIKIMLPLGLFQVTFSLQFFFALLAGFLLGAERGCMSVIVYLITGLIGIPIFAHGGGIGYLLKPTFGFLIGFAAAAAVCGYIAKKVGAFGRIYLQHFAEKWFTMRADSFIISLCSTLWSAETSA